MPEILIGPTLEQTAAALASWDSGILALAPASANPHQFHEAIASAQAQGLPDEACAIMPTSGSSGNGKLVVLPRSALTYSATATNATLGGPGNWAACLPTHHIAGFQTLARPALTGHRVLNAGRGTPEEIAALASRLPQGERTYLSLVPTQLARLLESAHAGSARAFSAILVGGASTPRHTLDKGRAAGLNLVTTYGMTETCGGCAYNGIPIGDTQMSTELGGRVIISGSVVAHGYLGHTPFAGTYTTNDAGTFTGGKLQITGRLDRAITSGGLTVLPEPIERVLEDVGAGESVVVGIPDTQWGERIVAVTSFKLEAPKQRLKPLLEALPHEFLTPSDLGLTSLPYLESGKPDRVRVSKLVAQHG
ncbi:AMP-binding protein [Ancrocorticia sp.]